ERHHLVKSMMDKKEKGVNNEMKPQSSDHPGTENPGPGKEERDLSALDNPAPEALDTDEIVTLARRYYATGFPNPQRRGCPPPGEIVKVVSRRRAPDNDLREHLFECSECFGEYRQALAQIRNDVVGWQRLVSILSVKRVSTLAVILLLVLAGSLIWRKPTPEALNEQITRSDPSGGQVGGTGEATSNKTDARLNAGPITAKIENPPVKRRAVDENSRSSGRPESSVKTIEVDLDNYQVLRRSQEEKPPIVLPAVHARLVLRLPETGAAGKYTVSLINAFGRVLLSTPALSHDGAKLQVKLDLRRVTPQKYRLRLSRNGEAPAYYDVIVGRR
ncbi:MAG TPA: hypothetical protein VHR27_01255, partial [Blastocatellia bacterium]|nr:hypothetical protein [Blastocatellia bacterium]